MKLANLNTAQELADSLEMTNSAIDDITELAVSDIRLQGPGGAPLFDVNRHRLLVFLRGERTDITQKLHDLGVEL